MDNQAPQVAMEMKHAFFGRTHGGTKQNMNNLPIELHFAIFSQATINDVTSAVQDARAQMSKVAARAWKNSSNWWCCSSKTGTSVIALKTLDAHPLLQVLKLHQDCVQVQRQKKKRQGNHWAGLRHGSSTASSRSR